MDGPPRPRGIAISPEDRLRERLRKKQRRREQRQRDPIPPEDQLKKRLLRKQRKRRLKEQQLSERQSKELKQTTKHKTSRIVFRLSDIPLRWTVDEVWTFLQESIPSMDRINDHCLVLHQSIDAKSQIGILTLIGPRDVMDEVALPENPRRPVKHKHNNVRIMVDRDFYGLTPLNDAIGASVVELVTWDVN